MAASALVATLLTGCSFDALDVERRSLVDVIAIDTGKDGNVAVTYGFSDLQGGGGGSKGTASNGMTYVTESAPTASQAIVHLENTLSSAAFYGATRLIVLGESALTTGVGEGILATARLRETPQSVLVAAVKGQASSFISTPSISTKKPIYFTLKSQSLVNSVMSGARLFQLEGNATTTDLASMVPTFALEQGLARFIGSSVLVGGRQRAFLPVNDASVIHGLVAAGPDTIDVSIPDMGPHPFVFRVRRAYANVTPLADGSLRVSWHGEGRLDERQTLGARGFSDKAIEQGLAQAILKHLKDGVSTLLQAGVDPRQIAGEPATTAATTVHTVVHVHLDRGQMGP